MFEGKNVVLGVTGSIAAYKAVDLASKLTQAGLVVDVIMTRAATEFVTPLCFRSVTHRPVVTDMFDATSEYAVEHVALARKADVVVVAPATANTIARMSLGIADDSLGCTVLATEAPVIVAPAMDAAMYENPATRESVSRLQARGFIFVGPARGRLASGEVGLGRFVDTEELMGNIYLLLGRDGDLAGRKIVVSAGGTQEPLDPVRHLGNRSTGKMGYAVAEAARDRGAKVILVSAPTYLRCPVGVDLVAVQTALQMRDAVMQATPSADALVMAAAVADYRPATAATHKLKREAESQHLDLVKTPDIIGGVPNSLVKVGFAAESEELVAHATEKVRRKGLDFIVVNDITAGDAGFAVDTNRVIIIDRDGRQEELPLLLKSQVAHHILDRLVPLLQQR